jgi:SEC-C motif-containing protein
MASKLQISFCPCGINNLQYAQCCGRFIDGVQLPHTAAELMRSRYTAYTLCNDVYLRATWHPSTCPKVERITEDGVKWLGLEIKNHAASDDEASVEFVARYRIDGRAQRLHETSRFLREDGRWLYLDGRFQERKS